MRVVAHRVRMPDINHGACDRFAGNAATLAPQEQALAAVGAIIYPRFSLRDWRPSDVERSLNGAHCAACEPSAPLGFVEPQVEEMLEYNARHDQPKLVLFACLREVGNAAP